MNGDARLEEQFQKVERLIVAADAVLLKAGFFIEAEGYEDYADALRMFLREGQLTEAETQELEGVGDIIRKVAKAVGAVKGARAGIKTRWKDFKQSVKDAHDGAKKKTHDKLSGRKAEPAKEPEKKEPEKEPEAAKEPEKKAAPAKKAAAKPKGKGRARGPGSMSDNEYKRRYGVAKHAARGQRKKRTLKLVASMESLADFQQTTGVDLSAATIAAWEMLENPKFEGGRAFESLSAVEPEARVEGKSPTHVCAAPLCTKGIKGSSDYCKAHEPKKEEISTKSTSFQRLAGIVSATNGWRIDQ